MVTCFLYIYLEQNKISLYMHVNFDLDLWPCDLEDIRVQVLKVVNIPVIFLCPYTKRFPYYMQVKLQLFKVTVTLKFIILILTFFIFVLW